MKSPAQTIRDLLRDGNGVGKTGDEVSIACEDAESANLLFEALIDLMDEPDDRFPTGELAERFAKEMTEFREDRSKVVPLEDALNHRPPPPRGH